MSRKLILWLFLPVFWSITAHQPAKAIIQCPKPHHTANNQPAGEAPTITPGGVQIYPPAAGMWSGYRARSSIREPFPTHGVLSIVSGIFPVLAYTAFSLTFFPFFLIPGFIFSTAALVLGAKGLKRPKKGYAIAGLSMGILELLSGFICLIMFLAFLV